MNDEMEKYIREVVIAQLSDFNSAPVATHTHNGWDANRIDPAVSIMGFPVYQVADASVAPTDQADNGDHRYQVDFKGATPHYYLWAYLVYLNATNVQVAAWKSVQLT